MLWVVGLLLGVVVSSPCHLINELLSECVGKSIYQDHTCQIDQNTGYLSWCQSCSHLYPSWIDCHCSELTDPYGISYCKEACIQYFNCEAKLSFNDSSCIEEMQTYVSCANSTTLSGAAEINAGQVLEQRSALNPAYEKELIFEPEDAPWSYSHVCSIAERSDGSLVAVFQSGPHEAAPSQNIYYSQRFLSGTWSKPDIALTLNGSCVMNPSLFQPSHSPQTLYLTFHYGGAYDGTASCNTDNWKGAYIVSEDGGNTWKNDTIHYLPFDQLGTVKNKCIEIEGGVVLCPSSREAYINNTIENWRSVIERTDTSFQDWQKSNFIMWNYNHLNGKVCPYYGIIQPTLFEIKPGVILALLRSGCGAIASSVSVDGGVTFQEIATPTSLPNPNAGIDGVLMKNQDSIGIILLFNDSPTHRTPLTLAQSLDGGQSWIRVNNLETTGYFAYPAVIQSKIASNVAHSCYTYSGPRSQNKNVIAYTKISF